MITAFLHKYSKGKIVALLFAILIFLTALFYGLSYLASIHAAEIFNKNMAEQKFFKGHIKVERLSANIFGRVSFTNLVWDDGEGKTSVEIPEGSFKVKPLDVITKTIAPSTVTNIELNDARLVLTFDDTMHINGLEAKRTNKKRQKGPDTKEFTEKLKNADVVLKLNNCAVTALYKNRAFIMERVNANIHYDSKAKLTLAFRSNSFGGTLEAEGLNINGSLDLKPEVAVYNLDVGVRQLNPSSLGTGLNIHEKVTAAAHVSGPLPEPVITGKIAMDELNLPALHFTDLTGDLRYDYGQLIAYNVKAKIFGGTCEAFGGFNLDTKGYTVDVKGYKLRSERAARSSLIRCAVDLDLKMRCNGDNKSTKTYGSFVSGPGVYTLLKFDCIRGSFFNQYKTLRFSDVVIYSMAGDIMAPSFSIVDGKLKLGEVYFGDHKTGEKVQVH